jgi:hypothetical protein
MAAPSLLPGRLGCILVDARRGARRLWLGRVLSRWWGLESGGEGAAVDGHQRAVDEGRFVKATAFATSSGRGNRRPQASAHLLSGCRPTSQPSHRCAAAHPAAPSLRPRPRPAPARPLAQEVQVGQSARPRRLGWSLRTPAAYPPAAGTPRAAALQWASRYPTVHRALALPHRVMNRAVSQGKSLPASRPFRPGIVERDGAAGGHVGLLTVAAGVAGTGLVAGRSVRPRC